MNNEDFANVYLDPVKMSKMKNSFFEYKSLGGTSIPKLILKRNQHSAT